MESGKAGLRQPMDSGTGSRIQVETAVGSRMKLDAYTYPFGYAGTVKHDGRYKLPIRNKYCKIVLTILKVHQDNSIL